MIVTSFTPHRAPINSVCPVKAASVLRVASLFIGSVTIAAISPASAAFVADTTYARAALPEAPLSSPGVISSRRSNPASITFSGPAACCAGEEIARKLTP